MAYNSCADVVRLLAERYDTKLGRFRSQLQASCVSSHTEELWYNETVNRWMTIYIYIYIYIIKARFIKDDGTLFIIFNCNFSSLLFFSCRDLGGKGIIPYLLS